MHKVVRILQKYKRETYFNMNDTNNATVLDGFVPKRDCPIFSHQDNLFLESFSFWVEGVVQTICAVFGIIGNILAGIIITRKDMRNSFNLLLVSLACFDSTYLLGSILDSIRKPNIFGLASETHIILFPYLLYPANQIAISGSIFMTVAIAWERYIAVHYPLDYNQAMNDSHAIRKRLMKYVGPVMILAIVFNLGKFFEGKIVYKDIYKENIGNIHAMMVTTNQPEHETNALEIPSHFTINGDGSINSSLPFIQVDDLKSNDKFPDKLSVIDQVAELDITEFRKHPAYSMYLNWSRLLVLGIIPFSLLVFFNSKIYNDINERRKRRLRIARPSVSDVTNCVEVPSRRQSDLPLVPPPRKSSYGVTLDEIQLQRMPSLPLKKRMSKKLRQGSGFLRNLKEKNNALKNDDLKGSKTFSNNNRKNNSHQNIEYSNASAKTNGTIHTNTTYLNENVRSTNQCIDDIPSDSSHKFSKKEGDRMQNGNMNENRSIGERNGIEKPYNVTINSNNIEQNNSVIPQVIINDGEEEDEVFEDKKLPCINRKDSDDIKRRKSSCIRFEEELPSEYVVEEKEISLSPEVVVTGDDYDVSGKTAAAILTLAASAASATNNRLKLRHVQSVNEKRRYFEDNLAAIFMGFVFVFLICHMPRLFLNIHELIVMEGAMKCQMYNQEPFSMWSLILINVSHFLLVLNSSTNILVYCFMSSKFRKECNKLYLSCKKSSFCKRRKNNTSSAYAMSPRRVNTAPAASYTPSQNKQYLKVPTQSNPLPTYEPNSNV